MILAAALGAFFFAAAGAVGTLLGLSFADRIDSLPDGPPQQRAPIAVLLVACAVIGAFIAAHGNSPAQIVVLAIVCLALAAIWIVDARRGIVPDAFTLGPLALILLFALYQHHWGNFIAAIIPLTPFAAAAALSKGRGMGWGDVKLVALGGAVLGVQWAVAACIAACLAAVGFSYAAGRRRGPIAFAPFLTAAIGAAIPIAALH